MSCPLRVGQARAQDSCRIKVPKTYTEGLQMRPFFISIRGALTQSQPRYYVTANQSKRGVFGIRRPLVGGHCRVCRGLHKDGGHGPEIW